MGYDRGDSFPFDFKPKRISFGSESKGKQCHHDHILFDLKGNGNVVFSVYAYFAYKAFTLILHRM